MMLSYYANFNTVTVYVSTLSFKNVHQRRIDQILYIVLKRLIRNLLTG